MMRKSAQARGPVGDEDAELLERLGRIAETIDPPPEDIVLAAKALFALRDPMAVLMETVSQDDELMSVRGETDTLVHLFERGDVAVDLELSMRDGFASMLGVITGPQDSVSGDRRGAVSLQTASATFDVAVGADGRFGFERVPVGMFRLQVRVPGWPTMTTGWVDANS